jgi:hypothetical protein
MVVVDSQAGASIRVRIVRMSIRIHISLPARRSITIDRIPQLLALHRHWLVLLVLCVLLGIGILAAK